MLKQICQCECGQVKFTLTSKPLLRLVCHCEICQKFNQSDSADILVFRQKDVELSDEHNIEFKTYRPPPAVQRGKCLTCLKPAIELFDVPFLPKLSMVPRENMPQGFELPKASFHMFYHRRVNDVLDDLPKLNGYFSSQVAFMRELFSALVFK